MRPSDESARTSEVEDAVVVAEIPKQELVTKREKKKPTAIPVEVLERRRMAVDLRRRGFKYREIVQMMRRAASQGKIKLPANYNTPRASRDVQKELEHIKKHNQESAEQLRLMMTERLEEMRIRLMPLALGQPQKGQPGKAGYTPATPPDTKYVDRVLKIEKQLADLHGLDQVENNITNQTLVLKVFKNVSMEDI